jgi:Ankyrin repeats (many copies)
LCEQKQNDGIQSLVEDFIQNGGDVNAKNGDGWTLLQYAVLFENPAIVKLLLEKGANAKRNDGIPTISCVQCCSSCSSSDGGSVVDSSSSNTSTGPLHIIKLLVDSGANIDEIHPGTGLTMLHGVLLDTNYEFAKELLGMGAHPNIKNKSGDTALAFVLKDLFVDKKDHHLEEGDQKCRKQQSLLWMLALMMLDKGGDLFVINNKGKAPVDSAEGREVENTFLLAYSSISTRLAKLEVKIDQTLAHAVPQKKDD